MIRRALWIAGAPVRIVLLGAIHLYRVTFAHVMGGQCRFHPTCSAYALEAVRTHGAARGALLTAWRILRCSPLTAGGIEAVPPRGDWLAPFRRRVRQRHTTGEAA